jgi:uncharacterized protein
MGRDLQVVLKISERCNINCSYCYYFNSGNEEPFKRPAFVSEEVAKGVVRFVSESAHLISLGTVQIILHGGEPLMLKKRRFGEICNILSAVNTAVPNASISMTTNAMLVDDEWIDIFAKFKIRTCVSLDGPQQYHDLERVDFNGRGTYTRVIAGIRLLKAAAAAGRINEPTVLSVIDPRAKGDVVYDHIVRHLGFRLADFLVPLTIHDKNPKPENIKAVSQFLRAAFAEWVKDDDPNISIRIFNRYMNRLLGRSKEEDKNPTNIVVGVGSDGTMMNDDLMQILGPDIFDRNLNVCRNDISEYLSEVKKGVLAGVYTPHDECVKCNWFEACQPPAVPWAGAELRYKRETGFRNKLVHCEAFQDLFGTMTQYISDATVVPNPIVNA